MTNEPYEGGEDDGLDAAYEDRTHVEDEPNEEYEPPCGWPGDGSGEDDLADFNAAEADDYQGE